MKKFTLILLLSMFFLNGISQRVMREYYYWNGPVRSEYQTSDNGVLNGYYKIFSADGWLYSTDNYQNGRKNGVSFIHSKFGQITHRSYYKNDELHGISKGIPLTSKGIDGRCKVESYYNMGILIWHKEYYDDLSISYEFNRNGRCSRWNEDGVLKETWTCKDGNSNNDRCYFFDDGLPSLDTIDGKIYSYDKEIGNLRTIIYDSSDLQVLQTFKLSKGVKKTGYRLPISSVINTAMYTKNDKKKTCRIFMKNEFGKLEADMGMQYYEGPISKYELISIKNNATKRYSVFFYKDSILESSIILEDSLYLLTEFNENGTVRKTFHLSEYSGTYNKSYIVGIITTYDEVGNIEIEEERFNFIRYYYPSGNLHIEYGIRKEYSEKGGFDNTYYENGNIKSTIFTISGEYFRKNKLFRTPQYLLPDTKIEPDFIYLRFDTVGNSNIDKIGMHLINLHNSAFKKNFVKNTSYERNVVLDENIYEIAMMILYDIDDQFLTSKTYDEKVIAISEYMKVSKKLGNIREDQVKELNKRLRLRKKDRTIKNYKKILLDE